MTRLPSRYRLFHICQEFILVPVLYFVYVISGMDKRMPYLLIPVLYYTVVLSIHILVLNAVYMDDVFELHFISLSVSPVVVFLYTWRMLSIPIFPFCDRKPD